MIKLLNVFKYKKTKAPFVLFKNTIALLVLLLPQFKLIDFYSFQTY